MNEKAEAAAKKSFGELFDKLSDAQKERLNSDFKRMEDAANNTERQTVETPTDGS